MNIARKIPTLIFAAWITGIGTAGAYVMLEEEVGRFIGEAEEKTRVLFLTDPHNYTVYIYDRDQPGKSTCYDDCAKTWPPVFAEDNELPVGFLTIIKRDDGKRQWAHKGRPLYSYSGDTGPAQLKGREVGGVWHIVLVPGIDM